MKQIVLTPCVWLLRGRGLGKGTNGKPGCAKKLKPQGATADKGIKAIEKCR
ncbi:MAG: hypothetical protein Q8N23_21230 [Archangium sp.]|nr:hypothetical protein [Archangium sp.]MDP3155216.1 hypothetical protein [Archangium sp.]MDP3573934.1 hypothetical protein [Archangium sp.]